MHEMTEAFFPCWKAAGIHLKKSKSMAAIQPGCAHILPAVPAAPVVSPGNPVAPSSVSRTWTARPRALAPSVGLLPPPGTPMEHACILPMKKKLFGGSWVADMLGWGLLNAETRKPNDPVSLVTEEKIEMTRGRCMTWRFRWPGLPAERRFRVDVLARQPRGRPVDLVCGQDQEAGVGCCAVGEFPASSADRPTNWLPLQMAAQS